MRVCKFDSGSSEQRPPVRLHCRFTSNNASILLTLLALLGYLFLTSEAHAQVALTSVDQETSPSTLNEEHVVRTANDAFNETLNTELSAATLPAETTQPFSNRIKSAFRSDLAATINQLKGDGVLQTKEVTRDLGALRQRHLNTFRDGLSALQAGHEPPPSNDSVNAGEHALEMLSYTFLERNQLTDWARLAAIIVAGLFAAWIASKVLRGLAKALTQRHRVHVSDMTESMVGPVYMAIITVALYFASQTIWIPGLAADAIGKIVVVLLFGALFWFLWKACISAARGISWLIAKTYQTQLDQHTVLIVSRLLRIALVLLFILIIIKQVLNSNLTGFVAGLGVVGVALSFILRGTIENIAASFTIFGDKPFRVGDLIIYAEKWGRVEDIGFRSTRFRTLDGHLFTIPNSSLVVDAIQNVGVRPSIRRRFRVGLTYDTPPEKIEKAMQIVRSLLDNNESQPEDKPAVVVLEELGQYSLQLMIEYHFAPAEYWKAVEYDSTFNLKLLRQFNEAGIELAFPTQSLYLRGNPKFKIAKEKEQGTAGNAAKNNSQDSSEGSVSLSA